MNPVEREVQIEISKEDIKFSAAHFTIFPDGSRERLHGHNYRVRMVATYVVRGDGMAVDYGLLKRALRKVCAGLDEYLLLPSASRYLRIAEADGAIEATIGPSRFVFPAGDVIVLPVENITGEALAEVVRSDVLRTLAESGVELPSRCEVGIGSGDGQWVTVSG
ncbi:6-pyruvoyl tetrahydropterin synthase family protein [Silanimonas algicola]